VSRLKSFEMRPNAQADPRGERPEEVTPRAPSEADHGSSVLEGKAAEQRTCRGRDGTTRRKMQGSCPYHRARGCLPAKRDVACRPGALVRYEGDFVRCTFPVRQGVWHGVGVARPGGS
jgi:hypothetical protein